MKKIFQLALIGCILMVCACTKISTTEIGAGIIPPSDSINTKDTIIDVFAQVMQNTTPDSMRISKSEDMVLGYITNDPLFGTTQAIVNAEFKPTFYPHYYEVSNVGDSLRLDSIVLVLSYKGYWGDSTSSTNVRVYEIAQSSRLRSDSIYPSYAKMDLAAQIGQATIKEPRRLTDSIFPRYEQATNQIRIKLDSAFGLRLLKTFDSTDAYQSDLQFSNTFRGFSIVPQQGSNALLRINLQDTNSKVALYYRYKKRDGSGDSSLIRYFRTGTSAGGSNNIVRVRTAAEVNTYLNNSTALADSLLHLQSSPGLYVRIKTPGLSALNNRVIHRAELLMEQAYAGALDNQYTQPNLFLSAISSTNGNKFHIPTDISLANDGTVGNLATFGGYIVYKNDQAGNRIASYSFNISRYVQGVATKGNTIYDLILSAPVNEYIYPTETATGLLRITSNQFNYPASGRVRLWGSNKGNNEKRLRIRVVYSKI